MARVLTALVGLPLVVIVTYRGPSWLFTGLVAVTSVIALDEWLDLSAAGGYIRTGRWFLPFGGAVTASFAVGTDWVLGAIALSVVALMTVSLAHPVAGNAGRVTGGAAGLTCVSVLIGFLILLPREAALSLFGIVWTGDTAAYYGGRALGRRRLAPTISPGKTVEGALAGLLGSVAAGLLLINALLGRPPTFSVGAAVLAAAIAGQVGDLTESALKRSANVKDSSSLLPGHGGMLDRIDSLLFAAPVFYLLLSP